MPFRMVSYCVQWNYFVGANKHTANNTKHNCVKHSKQHCGMLQVTFCSFSVNPRLLVIHYTHHYVKDYATSDGGDRNTYFKSELNAHSPVGIGTCVFRVTFWLNDLLHTSYQYGRSPLWKSRWVFRVPCSLNDLLHILQQYGLSPLCVRWWVISLRRRLNY
jgi:hypothetical protein